jgi:gamma-glutamylcyclotransferase
MYYFAYGSNMNPKRMEERKILFSKRERAILKDYKLVFNKIASNNPQEGYANIIKDNENIVEGVLYKISEADIVKLDNYEGYPYHYYRDVLKIETSNQETVNAVAYIANKEKIKHSLKPSKSYMYHIMKGCDLLSNEYCNMVNGVGVLD